MDNYDDQLYHLRKKNPIVKVFQNHLDSVFGLISFFEGVKITCGNQLRYKSLNKRIDKVFEVNANYIEHCR